MIEARALLWDMRRTLVDSEGRPWISWPDAMSKGRVTMRTRARIDGTGNSRLGQKAAYPQESNKKEPYRCNSE
jgi:hypothetical protein